MGFCKTLLIGVIAVCAVCHVIIQLAEIGMMFDVKDIPMGEGASRMFV
jgi:hypothetical protein